MQINNAPEKSATAFAQSGSKNTIPEASQIGISHGAASFTDGFPPLTMTPLAAGGVPPYGQDFNGILHFLSNAIRWSQMGAGYSFDTVFAEAIGGYPKGAVIRSDDGLTLWQSQEDNNTNNPNIDASNNWLAIKNRWPTWDEISDKPDGFGAKVVSISSLPTSDIGPVIVAEASEVWIWVSTPYYTGYRSPLCGRPVDGHTVAPLASEIDAVGGLVLKASYAGLWGYAQENNLVVSQFYWTDNIGGHFFVDVSNSQFRVPDLRNQFRRYTGTDADSANARGLGMRQKDALQAHRHRWNNNINVHAGPTIVSGGSYSYLSPGVQRIIYNDGTGSATLTDGANGSPRLSAETRPVSVAYRPRIHA